jgi:hypothetical protein
MSRRRFLQKKKLDLPKTVFYTKSGTYDIPEGSTIVQLFIVGGGGGGSGDCGTADHSGCGGNGGQVVTKNVIVINNSTITITIGQGGTGGLGANDTSTATSGGNTVVKLTQTYTAYGGSRAPSLLEWYDSNGDNSIRPYGQYGGIGAWKNNGEPGVDGIKCDFIDSQDKYGASGGGGSDYHDGWYYMAPGGTTGGGTGGGSVLKGGDATFYGAGGGGAAFSSRHYSGGNGFQGIVIAKYN